MEIIDAQIHPPEHFGHIDPKKYDPEFLYILGLEMNREVMDAVGVDAAILSIDIKWIERAMQMYPDRFVGCVVPIEAGEATPDDCIGQLRKTPGVVGFGVPFSYWKTMQLVEAYTSGKVEPFIAAAEKHGLPLFLGAQGNARHVEPLARKYPNLTIVLNHLGLPSRPPMALVAPNVWETLPDLLNLAKYPNVALKFTGVTALSKEKWPYKDLWPNLNKVIKAYGPERLMWGSDYTRLRMAHGAIDREGPRQEWGGLYAENLHFLLDSTELSQGDKEKMFALTARRLLRWPKPAASHRA